MLQQDLMAACCATGSIVCLLFKRPYAALLWNIEHAQAMMVQNNSAGRI